MLYYYYYICSRGANRIQAVFLQLLICLKFLSVCGFVVQAASVIYSITLPAPLLTALSCEILKNASV